MIKDYIADRGFYVFPNEHVKECFVGFEEEGREGRCLEKAKAWYLGHLEGVDVAVVSE